ncbi:MAG: hypothetical protein WBP10_00015 [Thermoanaerobaculia bacterium]
MTTTKIAMMSQAQLPISAMIFLHHTSPTPMRYNAVNFYDA